MLNQVPNQNIEHISSLRAMRPIDARYITQLIFQKQSLYDIAGVL